MAGRLGKHHINTNLKQVVSTVFTLHPDIVLSVSVLRPFFFLFYRPLPMYTTSQFALCHFRFPALLDSLFAFISFFIGAFAK
jgi:hypothetical protein